MRNRFKAHVLKVQNHAIAQTEACFQLTGATKEDPLPYQSAVKLAETAFGVDENMAVMMVATGVEEGVILREKHRDVKPKAAV